MILTVISVLLACLIFFYPAPFPFFDLTPSNLFVLLIIPVILLMILPMIHTLALIPLEKLELKLIPHLIKRFQRDYPLRIVRLSIFVFIFLTFVFALTSLPFSYPLLSFTVWLIALGISLDLLRAYLRRITHFLDPFYSLDLLTQEAKKSIQEEKDQVLWDSIDSISEIALKSMIHNKIALGTRALNTFPPILNAFFASSKSISRINLDESVEKKTGQDEASYTVYYLLQRLELINSKALEGGLGTICSQIMSILGKIIYNSAQYDMSMVNFPVHVLGKFATKAQQYHFDDVAALGTSTLLAISKSIIQEVDLTYADLKDPFETIVNNLEMIAQTTFKKDKNIHIKMIIQPLKDLKELFLNEKMAQHRDTPEILQNIERVLAEFEALEQVMRSIPSIKSPSP